MIAEAEHLINTIKQMEVALDDQKANGQYDIDDDLQVTFPLNRCIVTLKEKYSAISRLHRERYEQVKSTSILIVSRLGKRALTLHRIGRGSRVLLITPGSIFCQDSSSTNSAQRIYSTQL